MPSGINRSSDKKKLRMSFYILVTKILSILFFICTFAVLRVKVDVMTIVSTRDFRANQSKYLGMVNRGEKVILKSRLGRFHLTPAPVSVEDEEEPKRDVTAEVCRALNDWKEYLDTGKSDKFRPARELLYELRDNQAQGL